MSDLEIDRARKQAPHCRVLSLSACQAALAKDVRKLPGFPEVIAAILRKHRVSRVVVPADFPYGMALALQKLRIRVKPRPGLFFLERETKSTAEVARITAALRMAEAAMGEAIRVLRAARPGKNRLLIYQNHPLTSERLRAVIDTVITQSNGSASHTIVAGGKQGCDPHETGFGPLRANEPIILDIFPRSQTTGYFGDITRTVVRGHASEAIRRLYHTVQEGQRLAFEQMRPDVPTRRVHQTVQDFFKARGYETGKRNGRMQGFFHGTGHGLGLEIHEPLFLKKNRVFIIHQVCQTE